jgi:hypothetical protein
VRVGNLVSFEQVLSSLGEHFLVQDYGGLQFDRSLRGPSHGLPDVCLLLAELLEHVHWHK